MLQRVTHQGAGRPHQRAALFLGAGGVSRSGQVIAPRPEHHALFSCADNWAETRHSSCGAMTSQQSGPLSLQCSRPHRAAVFQRPQHQALRQLPAVREPDPPVRVVRQHNESPLCVVSVGGPKEPMHARTILKSSLAPSWTFVAAPKKGLRPPSVAPAGNTACMFTVPACVSLL